MVNRVFIKRTSTDNSPPASGSLSPGELAVEMGVPTRLWVGVPTALDSTGRKLVSDGSSALAYTPVNKAGDDITGPTTVAVNSTSPALRITQTGSGNAFVVEDSASTDSTPFVIDANGRVIVGKDSTQAISGSIPQTQTHSTIASAVWASNAMFQWASSAQGAGAVFAKSRGGAIGVNGIVSNGDEIGRQGFYGDDGVNFIEAARIEAKIDGVPGTNDMPGRIVFSTTADGASSSTERMRIGSDGGVGIGAANSAGTKVFVSGAISGATTSFGVSSLPTVQPDVTAGFRNFRSAVSTAASAFTLPLLSHFYAQQGAIGAGSSITAQYGFIVDSSLVGATNNYGFYGNIPAGTGRYNFYAAGTADNYFAGNVGIGTSAPTQKLEVNGNIVTGTNILRSVDNSFLVVQGGTLSSGANIELYGGTHATIANTAILDADETRFRSVAGSERMRIDSTGVGIGTSAPTAKLEIVGVGETTAPTVGGSKAATIFVNSSTNAVATGGAIEFGGRTGKTFAAWKGGLNTGGDNTTGYLAAYTRNSGTDAAMTERLRITAGGNVGIGVNTPASKLDVSGEIRDQSGNVRSVPQNVQTAAYTLIASDNGKHISITTGGVTVPSGVFSPGDTVTIFNNSASSQTITQGASVTMYQVGTATTGNRTLAQRGLCTVLCVAADTFVVTGGGLT